MLLVNETATLSLTLARFGTSESGATVPRRADRRSAERRAERDSTKETHSPCRSPASRLAVWRLCAVIVCGLAEMSLQFVWAAQRSADDPHETILFRRLLIAARACGMKTVPSHPSNALSRLP
eukprot:198789-Prymnesium_polylepis.1